MNKLKLSLFALGLAAVSCSLSSCINNDDYVDLRPTALVTVRPADDGTFTLQLDNTTALNPTNLKTSPFGKKEVRALVNYTESNKVETEKIRDVYVNWIDSIRTKMPVNSLGVENDNKFGNDAIEIVKDWVTVAEDGYLTLRIRTQWGVTNTTHFINLLTGTNPENPYELELRHDANGDIGGRFGDALIAFNLNDLPRADKSDVKIKLKWKSFSGNKSAEFDLYLRPEKSKDYSESMAYSRFVE